MTEKKWKFPTLPEESMVDLLSVWVADGYNDRRVALKQKKSATEQQSEQSASFGAGLFGFDEVIAIDIPDVQPVQVPLRVGTDLYPGYDVFGTVDREFLSMVRPRVEKSKEEQKKRTKEKAEVFTPTFLVKSQNDLVDGKMLEQFGDDWLGYVMAPVLEITCGEGPYLMSPYDATTGEYIPIRDGNGQFQRVGLLDRKLVKVFEHSSTRDDWLVNAFHALRATYGYEWQGDNLVLARLNVVNTFFDYLTDWCSHHDVSRPRGLTRLAAEVLKVASMNLWQMDGLKNVLPGSCVEDCVACKKKLKVGHDGVVPVFHFRGRWITMEEMLNYS